MLYSSFFHGQHGLSFITQVGTSALTQAAGDGHADIVVELVKAGANLDLQRNVSEMFYVSLIDRQCLLSHRMETQH